MVDSGEGENLSGNGASKAGTSQNSSSRSESPSRVRHGIFGSFLHRDSDGKQAHQKQQHHPSQESALGHMLAPALSVAGAHNPFTIGALREDGSRIKTYTYGRSDRSSRHGDADTVRKGDPASSIPADGMGESGDEAADNEDTASTSSGVSSRKKGKRHGLRSFGRSLSPWRFHDTEAAGPSSLLKRSGSWRSMSRRARDSLDGEREKSSSRQADSDSESAYSIAPRNSAFQMADSDDDEESSAAAESDAEADRLRYSGGERSSRAGCDTADTTITEAEKVKAAAQAGDNAVDDSDADTLDSDDDFDYETLDNTLRNAGCTDLHDAWMQQSPSLRSPEEELHQGYYGPSDYDAAWKGAGPSGHDENDEGLSAPNVVIGQNYRQPSVELTGEGMDVLRLDDNPKDTTAESKTDAKQQNVSMQGSSNDSSASSKEAEIKGSEHPKAQGSASRLVASRPIFERNRCTITLVHGEYKKVAAELQHNRRYIVASDGSEESSYAIEWTIGTVLRDGDEMLVVSVMETDTKLDASHPWHEDKRARQEHQRIRQSMAVILARRAVAVLQRTRLAVKVSCQALHARNSRHMFIDMIDFFQPTMCVVGSRGLGSLKGVLLGSFSNYCVQKSPVPVMVARKRLKLPALPRGKNDVVSNVRRRHMRLDEATIDKDANVSEETPIDDKDKVKADTDSSSVEREASHVSAASQTEASAEGQESKDSTARLSSDGATSTDSTATVLTEKDEDVQGTMTARQREKDSAQRERDQEKKMMRQDAAQAAALQETNDDEQEQRGRDRRSRSPTDES